MILLFLSLVSCAICYENSKNMIENVLEIVHKECSFDIDSPCLQPIRETSNLFEVLPPKNLALCRVKNEMFETSMATMCYLNRTEQFFAQRRHIHTEDGNNWLCGVENQRDALGQMIPPNITYFAVITHPIDRFMNAFVKKCKGAFKSPSCYGCNSDVGCMINTIYEKSKEFSKKPYWRKFGHFYLEHFLPQTWFCPFTTDRFSIVSYASQTKRKSANDKFLGVLHKANVTYEKLTYIETELEQLPKTSINLELNKKFTKELLESEDFLRKFLHIYYFDFIYFGIQMV
ncbi:unnamed protein product, partial [Mesorhabditis belari]|uniref:Uncharacterized protein n=1 Tax=Mesorhabditis belari TaxID=2138241 RepID=A0AAF3EX05_9BILA